MCVHELRGRQVKMSIITAGRLLRSTLISGKNATASRAIPEQFFFLAGESAI